MSSQRKMVAGLQGSQRITTSQKWVEKSPYWQSIMSGAYQNWRRSDLSYEQFLLGLQVEVRRLVILGNFNYQVCNGGFSQWIYNHYFNPSLKPLVFDAFCHCFYDYEYICGIMYDSV